jgi:hypothetical protein
MARYDIQLRLEPRRPEGDLDSGFRAEIADPAWFLARQWQLAEHQGEDAASPVWVRGVASHTPLDPYDGDPALDPMVIPAEAIIESEPDGWWTIGRRARIGAAGAPLLPFGLPPSEDAALRFLNLVPPYDRLNGGYDGLALHRRRAELNLPAFLFAELPAREPADLWDPAELSYTARFTAGGGAGAIDVPRHDGGDVDWYSATAPAPLPVPTPLPQPFTVVPGRMRYPGAPHPRWWQIEDARVDIGGFPPDRGHFGTMLLIDLVVSHADDWFTFPVEARAGTVVTLHSVEVRDAFDDITPLTTPTDWSLYRVDGLDPTSLVVWPTATTPLTGAALDEVVLGADEDANLLWAVERRAAGRELAPAAAPTDSTPVPAPETPPDGQLRVGRRKEYDYRPSTTVPRYWHPYPVREVGSRRRYVQGRLANLETRPPTLAPPPVSALLLDRAAPAGGPVHQIEPATVPTTGLRLDRRFVLGRGTDGRPVLWLQRRRQPLLGPPVSNLRYDVLEAGLPVE